ncbi:hypothetical protein J5Y04_31610 [Kitasatospora sp. RG8]|uniref:hypothetical protein n=1 Tax=Kitasatospora sp. RG8 TaxID=2820815 RepID=UPI001AE06AC0|nr:hypothetical protein [Kitasatospora sp. RG8]MBP0454055.1 hypothetical protein [Kitasatospora sp. RG8]
MSEQRPSENSRPGTPPPGVDGGWTRWDKGASPSPPRPREPRRLFLWIFLAVQALFVIWIITGSVNSTRSAGKSCAGLTGQDFTNCINAGHVGTTIGIGLIVGLWAAVDIILGITYLIYRLSRRDQP